jgi:UDP-N-acetyl-D-mannosaminuronic acid transferase (WecB/TagA/CpsF family)
MGLQFLSGRVKRAPRWMRRARLEWLHRLAQEPLRLARRYLVDDMAVFPLWARWRAERTLPRRAYPRTAASRG